MSDDQIALAMELHYGLRKPWEIVARQFGVCFVKLRRDVYRAQHRGMRG